MLRFYFFLLVPLFALTNLSAQAQQVVIHGQVIHAEDPTFNLLLVNKSTSQGVFGNADGSFELTIDRTDSVLVGALGYQTELLCVKDSAEKSEYSVRIYLRKISRTLNEVRIFERRELDSIQNDIRELGYDERDYMLTGIDAMSSPLTFLYQQISKQERMKRRAYEIINADRKRDLLKELFIQYVDYDIIDLQPQEFEDFIDYMNVPDHIIRSMSQYDFVIYTKRKFNAFRTIPPKHRPDLDTHD